MYKAAIVFLMILAPMVTSRATDNAFTGKPTLQPTAAFLAMCKTDFKRCKGDVEDAGTTIMADMDATSECFRKNAPDDPDLLTRQVVDWLVAHPDMGGTETKRAIDTALNALYCGT
jgi:hypothetical protein